MKLLTTRGKEGEELIHRIRFRLVAYRGTLMMLTAIPTSEADHLTCIIFKLNFDHYI